MNKHALLLVGSAKPAGKSASEALGTYLLDRLAEHGFTTDKVLVFRALRTESRTQALLQAVDSCDLFILAFPLYVDTLPYLVTRALERIAQHRQGQADAYRPRFLAIANCGFPEAHHNDTALAICRQFAQAANLEWVGGLARGAGQPLGGKPLVESGGMARDAITALDMAADILAADGKVIAREDVPGDIVGGDVAGNVCTNRENIAERGLAGNVSTAWEEKTGRGLVGDAAAVMARPVLSPRLYGDMGDSGWRLGALRNGVYRQLSARPFSQQPGQEQESAHDQPARGAAGDSSTPARAG